MSRARIGQRTLETVETMKPARNRRARREGCQGRAAAGALKPGKRPWTTAAGSHTGEGKVRNQRILWRQLGSPQPPAILGIRAFTASTAEPDYRLHECRHTFATLMIAAGVPAKALQTFIGHSSITVTLDRYGHLFRAPNRRRRTCSMPT